MKDCLKKAKFMEIDCDEIIVPFAVPQGCWLVQNLHFVIIFARVVQIAFVAIGFYTWYCRWQVAISALRFSVFTSVQLGFSSFLRVFFLLRMRGNLLIYRKMSISRLLWGDRWKLHGEIQRHAIVTTYMFMTLWPVWGYFCVDQPTSTTLLR